MTAIIIDQIPGDKSISHRAVIISALANGSTTFKGFLCSDDCLNTLRIFKQLGIQIKLTGTVLEVKSNGVGSFQQSKEHLNVGNSGTGIRLITGALAGANIQATLTGDQSIQKRPMARIITPLTEMGADIRSNQTLPPLNVRGNPNLRTAFSYTMPMASAQVKSAILLAATAANVPVKVIEPERCRDHTERMLALFGASISSQDGVISLEKSNLICPKETIQIPGDISSALFFICYALMNKTAVTLKNIGLNESRVGCLSVLEQMGANISVIEHKGSYEPMGDIHVEQSNNMKNISVPLEVIPNVIDELPILAILAITQPGIFKVRGAEELRVKESDRIAGICRLIKTLGGTINEHEDGFDITGQSILNPQPFSFDSHFDHRLAMSAMIIASTLQVRADINGRDSIATSFPNFVDLLKLFDTKLT